MTFAKHEGVLQELASNKFKNSKGKRLTLGLFIEKSFSQTQGAVYSLKQYDQVIEGKNYPSLYKLYMEMEDTTEFLFASKYLDTFSHWEELCDCSWFRDIATQWRKELELKLKSDYLNTLRQKAREGTNRESLAASKYLLDKGWDKKPRKDRVSKQEVSDEAERRSNYQKLVDDDFDKFVN